MSDAEKRPVKPNLNWKDLCAFWYWLGWIMEWIVYGLSKLAIFKILEFAAKLTILVALILYFYEAPQRKRQAELNAWQIINSAMNQKAASGRVEALEYLNNVGVDLSFLDVRKAYLVGTTKDGNTRGINLPGAKLREANFSGSTLTKARFRDADLSKALLLWANLEGANFQGTNLEGANFQEADLSGADLEGANLAGANLSLAKLAGAKLQYTIIKLFNRLRPL